MSVADSILYTLFYSFNFLLPWFSLAKQFCCTMFKILNKLFHLPNLAIKVVKTFCSNMLGYPIITCRNFTYFHPTKENAIFIFYLAILSSAITATNKLAQFISWRERQLKKKVPQNLNLDFYLPKRTSFICFNESPLKFMKNAFLFHLWSFFRSHNI